MTSPQKAKGNAWENTVAKHLTELYGESFIRVPHSGAYIGGTNQHRKEILHEGQIRSFKGDIIPGQSFPRLNAECKSYKDFPFHQLFQGTCKTLDVWIELFGKNPNNTNLYDVINFINTLLQSLPYNFLILDQNYFHIEDFRLITGNEIDGNIRLLIKR